VFFCSNTSISDGLSIIPYILAAAILAFPISGAKDYAFPAATAPNIIEKRATYTSSGLTPFFTINCVPA
jgi:hypothetical protein